MRMRLPTVSDAYRLAWLGTRRLPAPVGYGLAHTVADALWAWYRLRRSTTGVGQLERNLSRVLPSGTPPRSLRRATRAGMRSYMRYFYEAFALPGITSEQVLARVRADLDPQLHEDVRAGSIVMALPHMGNWDLIGAWACRELATVLTVAERLKPDDLFEQFAPSERDWGCGSSARPTGRRSSTGSLMWPVEVITSWPSGRPGPVLGRYHRPAG